jgi:hypothetical protein
MRRVTPPSNLSFLNSEIDKIRERGEESGIKLGLRVSGHFHAALLASSASCREVLPLFVFSVLMPAAFTTSAIVTEVGQVT